jgi:tetratricopeptide (TPR) repeat protein/transglutaminase-like putative cysteine protease
MAPVKHAQSFSLIAVLLLAAVVPLVAQPASVAVAADLSKEAFVIEHSQTRVVAEADGTGTRETSAVVRMQADAGVKQFAVLQLAYSSTNETIDIGYVRVRKADGTVVTTPDYNIQDLPAEVSRVAPMYSDVHEKHIAVRGLGVGDVLEYQVLYRVTKPHVPGHFWFEYSFARDSVIQDERLEIDVPREKTVNVFSPDHKPEIKEEGNRRIYRWAASNLAHKEASASTNPRHPGPNPDVQVTTFANWEAVGRWYFGLQQEAIKVTPPVQAKAAELTKGLNGDEAKIRALYNFVALRIHYIGLEFGIGRYQPHPAEDVLENGYGDCKDKHTLLAALLRAAGYDAWPALIHSSRKLESEVPSPAQFNHVITVIPLGGKLTWVDTTPEVSPYGFLLPVLRDHQALVMPGAQTPKLMTTPADAPFAQKQAFSAAGKLDAEGTFSGHVEQSYRGDVEVVLRLAFRQTAEAQWKELVQGFSYRLGFGGDVSAVQASPPEETAAPFHFSYEYSRKTYSDWANRQFTPPLPPIGIEVGNDGNEKPPTEPLYLGSAGELLYQSRMELPSGYSVVAPQNVDLVESYAEYHTTHHFQDGVLTSSRRFIIKQPEVPVKEWEQYRKFRKAVADDEGAYIRLRGILPSSEGTGAGKTALSDAELARRLNEAVDALGRNDSPGAEARLRVILAADPNYPGAELVLAQALAGQQKDKEALAALRRAEESAPNDSRPVFAAANYLMGKGQTEAAIEEWRKALKIEPGNRGVMLVLSNMLAGQKREAEAAEVIETGVKALPGDRPLQCHLGSLYLKAGQQEKAMLHLRLAAEGDGADARIDPAMLNNVAYTLAENKAALDLAKGYAEKSVAEWETHSQSMNADETVEGRPLPLAFDLAISWDTLGWVYYQMGDLERAESYVRASWSLLQSPATGDHLGQILERQGKKQQAAHLYQLALASESPAQIPVYVVANSILPLRDLNRQLRDDYEEIRAHYAKLTGKPPVVALDRLPNGEWPPTPTEEISRMRETKLGKQGGLSGSAEFAIVFRPGKVESARYLSGAPALKALAEKLMAAKYNVAFPPGSTARIARRATAVCVSVSGCDVILQPFKGGKPFSLPVPATELR